MNKDKRIHQQWIDAINDEGKNLTKWEEDFMISVTDQFERGRTLSEK